jgi:hypothetical protein
MFNFANKQIKTNASPYNSLSEVSQYCQLYGA